MPMVSGTSSFGNPSGREPPIALGEAFDTVLAAARAGADWAWRELYRETAPSVDRYLRARGVRDADDVVGETFVNVVRSIDRRSEEHTSELQSHLNLVCRLLLEKKKNIITTHNLRKKKKKKK